MPDEGELNSEPEKDLTRFIDYVLELSSDKNNGEPLHQAIAAEKHQLAFHLLEAEQSQVR